MEGASTMRRALVLSLVLGLVVATSAACLSQPGDTSQITFVSTSTLNGWKYDFYRNDAYPCSISGHQTFVVGTKVGSSATAGAPLLTWLHGGGVGFFDATGTPQPDTSQMTEQSATSLRGGIASAGLMANVRADAAGFRMLAVSYCNRDIYSGSGQIDPNNPNANADGSARTTNGLLAAKAAVTFTEAAYPTTKTFVAGGSAGSAGSYYVGWALQASGQPPAGIVGDASVVNVEQGEAAFAQGACTQGHYDPDQTGIIAQRLDPQIGNIDYEIDKLVSRGELTVPLLHIWNHGDVNTCGAAPVRCPLRDGTTVTIGNTDCNHQPLQAAIAAQGPTSRSRNLPVCVDDDPTPNCSLHVVTPHAGLVNTDPTSPADYNAAAMAWIDAPAQRPRVSPR
jgi:hypothetical protein